MSIPVPVLTCGSCGHRGKPRAYHKGQHLRADCSKCGRFIKFVKQEKVTASTKGNGVRQLNPGDDGYNKGRSTWRLKPGRRP